MTNTWYVIFTSSAIDCKWCKAAIELLQCYGIDYYEKDITNEIYKEEFLAAGHRTVPQVYREEELIGGYEKTQEHLRLSTAGAQDERLQERLSKF